MSGLFLSVRLKGERERRYIMTKKTRYSTVILLLVLCLCICPAAAGAKALVTVQVYKAGNSLILNPDVKGQIMTVEKYAFTYRGKESFSSVEKLLKNTSCTQINPSSVKWVSSNEKVAQAGSGGTVTGVKRGIAYVYPVPRGVYSYKIKGKYIIYLTGNVANGIKIYGGIGSKVKVVKP